MAGTRAKGQPDREVYNIFAALNQEQQKEKHDIDRLCQDRSRSHAQNFECLKRKWEGFTGVSIPQKLMMHAPHDPEENKSSAPKQPSPAESNQTSAAKTVKKVKTAAFPAMMPSHPDDKIDVDDMLVNNLRKELKKRQLVTTGRKAELQARLRKHLTEARLERKAKWIAKHAVMKEAVTKTEQVKHGPEGETSVGCNNNDDEMDVAKEGVEEETDVSLVNDSDKAAQAKNDNVKDKASVKLKDPPVEIEPAIKETTKTTLVPTKVSAVDNQPSVTKKQLPKSALKPSKYTSSNVQSIPQLEEIKSTAKPVLTTLAKDDMLASKELIPTKVSDSSAESSNTSVVASTLAPKGSKKISSTLVQTSAVRPPFKTLAGVAGSSSAKLLEEKKKAHAAASEARKARLAEMRQKNLASASSATKPPSSSHSKYAASLALQKMASNPTLVDSKSSNILAKMRQKAAKRNAENSAAAAPEMKPTKSPKHPSSFLLSSPNVKRVSQAMTTHPSLKPTVLKSILDPANKPSPAPICKEEMKVELTKPELKPLSPMQTYEMSDRDEDSSESESESDEEFERQRPKKAIPVWAKKEYLHHALEKQFSDGPSCLDPDKIFGEVLTCNLEEIFDKKKSRYHKRTSSGNWSKDHVTLAEKLTYKRTMGYDKNEGS